MVWCKNLTKAPANAFNAYSYPTVYAGINPKLNIVVNGYTLSIFEAVAYLGVTQNGLPTLRISFECTCVYPFCEKNIEAYQHQSSFFCVRTTNFSLLFSSRLPWAP